MEVDRGGGMEGQAHEVEVGKESGPEQVARAEPAEQVTRAERA